MNDIDLKGKKAVVTGGVQGIGFAVAHRLLESGADVSLWDMDESVMQTSLESLQGLGLGTVRGDVVNISDAEGVETAYQQARQAMGRVDILVHSAGIAGPIAPMAEYPKDAFKQVIDINVLGTFNVNRVVVADMIAQDYGRIVNLASVAGKEGNPGASPYSASKAAVIALTKSLGKELADYNIAVNCVTPAAARTRIFEQISQEHIDFMLSKIPRKRFLEVKEAAAMIAWLVSEENSFTTASTFDLSGGRATY